MKQKRDIHIENIENKIFRPCSTDFWRQAGQVLAFCTAYRQTAHSRMTRVQLAVINFGLNFDVGRTQYDNSERNRQTWFLLDKHARTHVRAGFLNLSEKHMNGSIHQYLVESIFFRSSNLNEKPWRLPENLKINVLTNS